MTSERKSKPFPWRCPKCLKREVSPVTIEYTSHVKHDGRVYDVAVRELEVPRCSACGELVFCNETEDQVMAALRDQLGLLQPDEIRSNREERRLTQKEVAESIGVAPETISPWETGAMIQARAMDTLLRHFFTHPELFGAAQVGLSGTSSAGSPGFWTDIGQVGAFTVEYQSTAYSALFPMVAKPQTLLTSMFDVLIDLGQPIDWGWHGYPATIEGDVPTGSPCRMAA